jgi:hypothetical protein
MEVQWLSTLLCFLRARMELARGEDHERGSWTLEAMIGAALLSAAAIVGVGYIVASIMAHGQAIK